MVFEKPIFSPIFEPFLSANVSQCQHLLDLPLPPFVSHCQLFPNPPSSAADIICEQVVLYC